MKGLTIKLLSFFIISSMLMINLNTLFAQEKGGDTNGTSTKMEEKKDNATKKEEPKKKKKEIGC